MCNKQFIYQYDNIWPYLQDLYQMGRHDRRKGSQDRRTRSKTTRASPGVADTVQMDHIKEHYYTTHPDVTPSRIIAAGPDLDFEAAHDRDALPGGPPEPLTASL